MCDYRLHSKLTKNCLRSVSFQVSLLQQQLNPTKRMIIKPSARSWLIKAPAHPAKSDCNQTPQRFR